MEDYYDKVSKGHSKDEAISYFQNNVGGRFDPSKVSAYKHGPETWWKCDGTSLVIRADESDEELRLKMVHRLADYAVESASQKDLTRLYWDDAFNNYNDYDLEELKEMAYDAGVRG
jgi:hypothetical protein